MVAWRLHWTPQQSESTSFPGKEARPQREIHARIILINLNFFELSILGSEEKNRAAFHRRPGYLNLSETRGFPSPPHGGFGFICVTELFSILIQAFAISSELALGEKTRFFLWPGSSHPARYFKVFLHKT
jgi:hypothetical protein